MMDATGLLDINIFLLEVEGSDQSVLRTLDLEATNIQVLLVELDGNRQDRQAHPIRVSRALRTRQGGRKPCCIDAAAPIQQRRCAEHG